MGLKAAKTALTLGNRLYTGYTLGRKIVGLGSKLMGSKSSKPSITGGEVSNMIYNKSNMGDAQYIPLGMKRMNMNSMRKSYLEKRR